MAVPRNVILVGFMGSGKSTVGRLLGERLGRPFIDLDQEIEARAGASIAQIFAEEGESGFRRREAELCVDVASVGGQVVACGGGALLDPRSRAALECSGFLVCLHVDLKQALRRLVGTSDRPLLAPSSHSAEQERVRTLWRQRQAHYASIPLQVDTSDKAPEEVVEAALTLLLADAAG